MYRVFPYIRTGSYIRKIGVWTFTAAQPLITRRHKCSTDLVLYRIFKEVRSEVYTNANGNFWVFFICKCRLKIICVLAINTMVTHGLQRLCRRVVFEAPTVHSWLPDYYAHLNYFDKVAGIPYLYIIECVIIQVTGPPRPIWLVLLLNTLTKTSLKQNGVVILDRYMADRASNMGNKAVLGIESPEENCATLNNLNATYVSVPQRHVCVMPTSHYRSHGSRAALIGGAEWPAHLLALLSHMLLC